MRVLPRFVGRQAMIAVMLCGTGIGLGCASDTTGPTSLSSAQQYWKLMLNHHAVALAVTPPYDTLQLNATLVTAAGTVLADSGVTTWTTSDTSVQVSATGLLTGIASTRQVTVIASHTIGRLTRADTAVVNVNDTTPVPRLASLTLQPNLTLFGVPYYELFGQAQFNPIALDSQGETIPNLVFHVISATPTILKSTDAINFRKVSAGHALLLVEATVYGVRKVDSLPFTVGWWHFGVVQVYSRITTSSRTPVIVFNPVDDTIAVGGAVAWENALPEKVDIVFDDPTAAQPADSATFFDGFAANFNLVIPTQGGGNIPAFAPLDTGLLQGLDTLGVRARRFLTAGTYRYHSTLYGTSGVIHVLPELQVP